MEKSNLVTYRGPTMVANTLHAAAILLKEGGDWDWFINLSASDYPLVTQDGEWVLPLSATLLLKFLEYHHISLFDKLVDCGSFLKDLLHTFSYLPRDLNFVDHTSNIGWKEYVISFLAQCFLHFLTGFDL